MATEPSNRPRLIAAASLAALLTVLVVIWALAGQGPAEQEQDGGNVDRSKPTPAIGGLQATIPLKDLAESSDLVVRGVPVDVTDHTFADNPEIPESAKAADPELYQNGRYREFRIEVAEYMKGEGPSVVVARTSVPPETDAGVVIEDQDEGPNPEVGVEQVFFLFEGAGIWTGGYLINGDQGVGRVEDDGSVSMQSGKNTSLAELREKVS